MEETVDRMPQDQAIVGFNSARGGGGVDSANPQFGRAIFWASAYGA